MSNFDFLDPDVNYVEKETRFTFTKIGKGPFKLE